jgi:hypothetical protein
MKQLLHQVMSYYLWRLLPHWRVPCTSVEFCLHSLQLHSPQWSYYLDWAQHK